MYLSSALTADQLTAWRCTVVSGEAEAEEGSSLPVRKLFRGLEWVYERAINGIPGFDGVEISHGATAAKRPLLTTP
jgi:hypothetical protein